MATLLLDDLCKSFDDATAVDHLQLEVASGELVVLLGPSGCGKSTTLRLVAGLESPTSGRIVLDGSDVTMVDPRHRDVAMVFQDYALYPHMTVRGNLDFPLRMAGMDREQRRRRVEDAAGLLGLGEVLDRLPRQLSGGQAQRAAMGRAIVRDPALFCMDEPLSNLDAKLRSEVRGEIAELQQRLGTTTLYVTHDQVEAMTLGHRVAVLRRGRLEQVAPPQELYDRPDTLFVARFVGSPPMNLLPARITDGEPVTLRVDGQRLEVPAGSAASRALRQGPAPATLGLRPESLSWARRDDDEGSTLRLEVAAVEALGHELIVSCRASETVGPDGEVVPGVVAARLSLDHRPEPGDRVPLLVDTSALHLFGDDGRRLPG